MLSYVLVQLHNANTSLMPLHAAPVFNLQHMAWHGQLLHLLMLVTQHLTPCVP